jgi:tetratricopeptide (TPR) repeat protein
MLKAGHKANPVTLERLEINPFSTIAADILRERKTGHLTVVRAPMRKVLYWAQGELVMAASADAGDSLPRFLISRGALPAESAAALEEGSSTEAVARVHESGLLSLAARQALLREWLTEQFLPLFNLEEGTAAFKEDEALPPQNRIFLQSTAALFVKGVRSIDNGGVLRRSLGDIQQTIQPARDSRFTGDELPLNDRERSIAAALTSPQKIDTFLKRFGAHSVSAAKVVIALLAVGIFEPVEERDEMMSHSAADAEQDLEILASLSSGDERSLRAVHLSRQLESLDYYQALHIPRAATRPQIESAALEMKRQYDPATFPPAVRSAAGMICNRIDEAREVLTDPSRRSAYDRLLASMSREGSASIQQRLSQGLIAQQNLTKAKELSIAGDYYGAIVLLRQAVKFAPESIEAWHLLGSCQERNPRWRRDAAESYQQALSIDPENTEVLISLGDLYRTEGLTRRAETCYADALQIDPDNFQAQQRLDALKRR